MELQRQGGPSRGHWGIRGHFYCWWVLEWGEVYVQAQKGLRSAVGRRACCCWVSFESSGGKGFGVEARLDGGWLSTA